MGIEGAVLLTVFAFFETALGHRAYAVHSATPFANMEQCVAAKDIVERSLEGVRWDKVRINCNYLPTVDKTQGPP